MSFVEKDCLSHINLPYFYNCMEEVSGSEKQVKFNKFVNSKRINNNTLYMFTVSGDANFTISGFTQLSIARALIELQSNAEKGFSQIFLWCVPIPQVTCFSDLQKVDIEFSASIGKCNIYM